jgi:hypothetical protein
VQAIALTLLAHGVVALLLVELERRSPRRSDAPQLQYVSIWPELPRDPPRPEALPGPPLRRQPPGPSSRAIRLRQEFPVSQSTEPPAPAPLTGSDPQSSSLPAVDWKAAAMEAAKRFAEGAGNQQTFSPAPQPQKKPCKPRKFDEQTNELMVERLPPPPDPDLVSADPKANCIVVGGYPKCVRKIGIPTRRSLISTELLAKRVAGSKPPTSSVPSQEFCE